MTHEYTLAVGGSVIPGDGQPEVSALAWAEGTLLALGSDEEVRAISRGDSHVVDLHGAFVIPLEADGVARWPTDATLAVGGPADLAVLRNDPRGPRTDPAALNAVAVLRRGHVVRGNLPGPPSSPWRGAHLNAAPSPMRHEVDPADPDPGAAG